MMNANCAETIVTDAADPPHKRAVRVKLSAEQIVERAQRAERLRHEARQRAEDVKRLVRDERAQIDRIATELERLSTEIRDGVAEVAVDCRTRLIHRLGVVQIFRTDTGEVVFERPMSGAEREKGLVSRGD